MAGRIKDEDIAEVREKTRIDDVISAYVALKNAGGGNLKGLCPFHDEKSPSFNVTPARGMYHCLAGETEVLTWDGIKPIRDLSGGTHRILGSGADWVEAPFKSYGVQPLMKLTLTRDREVKEIFTTDEHRWFVRSGEDRGTRREVLTKNLEAGDRLASTYPRNLTGRTTPSPFGIAHGYTFGDGALDGTGCDGADLPAQGRSHAQVVPEQRDERLRGQHRRSPPAQVLHDVSRPRRVTSVPFGVACGLLRRRRPCRGRRDGHPRLGRSREP